MGPLILIASFLLIVNHHVPAANGYELLCGPQFTSLLPAQKCTLKNATQYELDTLGELGFTVIQRAHNLTFSKGIVKNIRFSSSTLVSLKVFNNWIVHFEVAEEDNFSLKTLSIRSNKYRIISPTLRYLKSLEELTFQKCSLEFVNFNELAELEKLRVLDLSWNKIHSVKVDLSMPLVALESLDVSNNRLKDMKNFPDAFPSLKKVCLKRNSWYCDWVSEARGNIWTGGITVVGAESYCVGPRNEQITNNGGLCCRERPMHLRATVNEVVHEILGPILDPKRNSTQPTIVTLDQEDNNGEPSVQIYITN